MIIYFKKEKRSLVGRLGSSSFKHCQKALFKPIDLLSLFDSAMCNPHAKRLYDDLLNNYNRLIRPVSNNTEKLTVKLGLKLSQLIDVVNKIF